jgi:SAM-dependent methyltransferase
MAVPTSVYPLASTQTEAGRLALQARAWRPAAERLFDHIGVQAGWRCIDLGCGPVGVLEPLSLRVGPTGSVIGLDIDPDLAGADSAGGNISMVRGDALAPPPGLGLFDLTHARFLLAPLSRNASVLETMWSMTKPGGVIAVQEPDACSWKLLPGSRSGCYQDLVQLIIEAFAISGADFNAGRRLPELFSKLNGSSSPRLRAEILMLNGGNPYLRMPLMMAESLRHQILRHRLATEPDLDRLLQACDQLLSVPPSSFGLSFTLVQAWASKIVA